LYSKLKPAPDLLVLRAVKAPSLSPVPPFSPFSPITVKKVEESKVEKLQNLEKLAQYSAVGIPQEMIYPSFGQVEEKNRTNHLFP